MKSPGISINFSFQKRGWFAIFAALNMNTMKNWFWYCLVTVALASCGNSSENASDASGADSLAVDSVQTFGAKIEADGAIGMDSLVNLMAVGQAEIPSVKVEGKIANCCQTKGCWMNIEKNDGSNMRVTFKDYGFFVPKDCGGKSAIMQGRAYIDTTSVEDLRHYAEDEGKSADEIAKITEPLYELTFEAEGVIIR